MNVKSIISIISPKIMLRQHWKWMAKEQKELKRRPSEGRHRVTATGWKWGFFFLSRRVRVAHSFRQVFSHFFFTHPKDRPLTRWGGLQGRIWCAIGPLPLLLCLYCASLVLTKFWNSDPRSSPQARIRSSMALLLLFWRADFKLKNHFGARQRPPIALTARSYVDPLPFG